MNIHPGADAFSETYAQGKAQVVWTELHADTQTPISVFLRLSHSTGDQKRFPVLLESVENAAVKGRYSVIACDPDLIWRFQNGVSETAPGDAPDSFTPCPVGAKEGPLASFRHLHKRSAIDLPAHLPPMVAGLFGYMGYDMVRHMERLPDDTGPGLGLPDALFARQSIVAVFDGLADTITLVTPVYPDERSAEAAFAAAHERLATATDRLQQPFMPDEPAHSNVPEPVLTPATPEADFKAMVRDAKEYIAAGDIFQVVLSQSFSAPFELPPLALYRSLRRINPSPYLFFLDFHDFAIAGSSPETLVNVSRDRRVNIRPIAGTRPRGATESEDRANEADLLADEKELAEHLMLLDLGRNDVGRVSEIGTVDVTDEFIIERYSHVMHIVSNVEGNLREDLDAIDALVAGFPAGTVSGAPKVRAMEIIEEMETDRRGIYAGAAGYFSAGGSMDVAIALRTAILKDGQMYVQAGAGVVADSTEQGEHDECHNKARALFRAASAAVKYANERGN